jgi:Na+/proline symporter
MAFSIAETFHDAALFHGRLAGDRPLHPAAGGRGWVFTPRSTGSAREYFLAGGSVPSWLAAVSVLSATQSAATFLGGPDYGYHGDLTYLSGNIGGLLGAIFVAHVMIPRFYRIKATTAYELLTLRFSEKATRWAGGMFLIGRVFAGGARVYLAAIALAMVMTGSVGAQGIMIAAACWWWPACCSPLWAASNRCCGTI